MRILLIAYEFPPSPSPRALRWAYLSRELAMQGHELHVLAPRLAGNPTGLHDLPEQVRVHTTFAGPLMGLVQARFARRGGNEFGIGDTDSAPTLNWKGRLVETVKRALGYVLFPDIRAEWTPWARRRLTRLLREVKPDVVVVSHEPASTLVLGLRAGRMGYPWVADLGDPIDAPYTPFRWKRRAVALERQVCREADHVIVTTEPARNLLMQRYVLAADKCSVLTQGFEDRSQSLPEVAGIDFQSSVLELFYAGRFYEFRRPDELLDAVIGIDGVRLTIVTPSASPVCSAAAAHHPEKVRLFGALPHDQVLALQRRADVLVNIGNESLSAQIPGKLYEYLGAGRPILHLLAAGSDPAAAFFRTVPCGWTCINRASDILRQLNVLLQRKRSSALAAACPLPATAIEEYGWSRIGLRLEALLRQLRKPSTGSQDMKEIANGYAR